MQKFHRNLPSLSVIGALVLLLALLIQPALAQDTFIYWGGLIFSEDSNKAHEDRVKQWGEENGIPVEVVMINQNEMTQRVSAAIESGTLPDALDLGLGEMLLFRDQLEVVDDLYAQIGEAHGGWLDSVEEALANPVFEGVKYGVPYATNGNLLFRRNDLLEPAGFTEPPATWAELAEQATAANNPPEYYGMGFALSNVGDGNLTQTMLQTWGGRIADDDGVDCTIDSPETREFLTWITEAFAAGLFPPGATTWDGAGDNTAYQSGQAVFIANPGSVYVYMTQNDPDLLASTLYSGLPEGPVMRLQPYNVVVRAIPKDGDQKELAADLLAYLAEDEYIETYFNTAIYGPALQSQVGFSIFETSPVHVGLLDIALNGTKPGFPDLNNEAFSEFSSNFLIPKMIQRVVVDGLSIDEAVVETQGACQAIYDKYK